MLLVIVMMVRLRSILNIKLQKLFQDQVTDDDYDFPSYDSDNVGKELQHELLQWI